METYAIALKFGMIAFMILLLVEWSISHLLKKNYYSTFDAISGISSGMTNNLKTLFKLSIVIISYQWMYDQWAVFKIESSLLLYIIAFIGIDFAFYWSHRWNHEINIMWNRHIIHHSSEEFNLSCALRQTISGITQVYFFLYIPLAIIGIPPIIMNIVLPIHLFAQFWYHTRLIDKMGFLEKIIVTPSHHRVHHAINPEYIDKNYASIFILWDKWFGTFQEELEEVNPVYGVKKPVKTWNPLLINFMHVFQLIKDAYRTADIKAKFIIWFKETGWRPPDVAEKYPIEIIQNPKTQIKYTSPSSPFLNHWSVFQLFFHVAIQFHIIFLIPNTDLSILLIYATFCFISIFSYTSLMDRHWIAIPFELLKLTIGLYMVSYYTEILYISEGLKLESLMIYCYLMISLLITIYYSTNKNRKLIVSYF